MEKGIQYQRVVRIKGHAYSEEIDEIVEEYPLTIMINGEEFATLVCSPLDLKYLIIGFLASEGVITSVKQVEHLSIDVDRGFAYVEINRQLEWKKSDKRWVGSCCGKSRSFYFQSDAKTARTVMHPFVIPVETCFTLMQDFHEQAELFHRTGGVHQASLATVDGIEVSFHDIGRHNTLDKIYGYLLFHELRKPNHAIIFSGRISSEVLLKVSKMNIGFLLSKSAPTDLAVTLANDLNITTVGFLRGNQMNIYTHEERILLDHSSSNQLKGGHVNDRERAYCCDD